MSTTAVLPATREIDPDQLSTSRARALFSLGIVLPVLTTFFVGVRLYSRHMKGGKYGIDDWLLVAALIFFYGLTAALFNVVYLAWEGHHTLAAPDPALALNYAIEAGFYSVIIYSLVAACVRCSTCVLFIRIFIQKGYRYAAFANLAINICWGLYSIFVTVFQCAPVGKVFDSTIPGHCLDQKVLLLSLTIWGVICDAVTWALPVPMVWQLHARLSTKIGLTAILGLGLVAVAIGGLRIWTVATISFEDPLWDLSFASFWAVLETSLGIVCAAAASIAPAFEKFFIIPTKMLHGRLRDWSSSRSKLCNSKSAQTRNSILAATDDIETGQLHGIKAPHDVSISSFEEARSADDYLSQGKQESPDLTIPGV